MSSTSSGIESAFETDAYNCILKTAIAVTHDTNMCPELLASMQSLADWVYTDSIENFKSHPMRIGWTGLINACVMDSHVYSTVL